MGPLPKSKQISNIIVVIYYFLKWIEAKALALTTEFQVINFLKSRIISRYRIPNVLVNNNGPQFTGNELKWFYKELKIEVPNGYVEVPNKIIMNGLKKKFDALQ